MRFRSEADTKGDWCLGYRPFIRETEDARYGPRRQVLTVEVDSSVSDESEPSESVDSLS